MARLDTNMLMLWITAAATDHMTDLATHVAQRAGVTRRTANKAWQRLVEMNWLVREGTRSRPRFRPGLLRQVARGYALAGLEEDVPWSRDFAPFFVLPAAVQRMTQLPARRARRAGRGELVTGAFADVVLVDWERVGDAGTFLEPEPPTGIEWVFVNGTPVVREGTYDPAPLPGRALRASDAAH
jgi:hypothetical protein